MDRGVEEVEGTVMSMKHDERSNDVLQHVVIELIACHLHIL
jgi:hypothetical protein